MRRPCRARRRSPRRRRWSHHQDRRSDAGRHHLGVVDPAVRSSAQREGRVNDVPAAREAVQHRRARAAVSAGFPRASPSTSTTVSAATISSAGRRRPAALPRAWRRATSTGATPGSGVRRTALDDGARAGLAMRVIRAAGATRSPARRIERRYVSDGISVRAARALTTVRTMKSPCLTSVEGDATSDHVQPRDVVGRFAAHDAPVVPVSHEHDRRPAEAVVVARHAVGVGAGGPQREQIACGQSRGRT